MTTAAPTITRLTIWFADDLARVDGDIGWHVTAAWTHGDDTDDSLEDIGDGVIAAEDLAAVAALAAAHRTIAALHADDAGIAADVVGEMIDDRVRRIREQSAGAARRAAERLYVLGKLKWTADPRPDADGMWHVDLDG